MRRYVNVLGIPGMPSNMGAITSERKLKHEIENSYYI